MQDLIRKRRGVIGTRVGYTGGHTDRPVYETVKTGTTGGAGACLVSSGHRSDDRLIVVVLGSTSNDAT